MIIMIFGLGSIGKRHARIIKENYNHEVYAFSRNKNKKTELAIPVVSSWEEVERINPDIAFITNPTALHIETAIKCIEFGMHIFMEKPISDSKKNLSKLLKLVKKNKTTTYVAYCMRFHPVIMWLKKYLEKRKNPPLHVHSIVSTYLPEWRKSTNYLKGYSANKELGGGVILDLSHEIDYISYLFGDIKNLKVNSKRQSKVTMNTEDFADILLEFKNGCFGNLHMNFLSHLKKREVIMNFEDETIVGDFTNNKIIVKGEKERVVDLESDYNTMYVSQINYFFRNIKNRKMMNNISDAMKVFDIILKIKKQVKK